jgi:hypothetical protein
LNKGSSFTGSPVSFQNSFFTEAGRHREAVVARVSAAGILLDRGWGKAVQTHSDADGGPIQVIIRQLIDVTGEAEPVLIEHEPDRRSR